MKLAALIIFGLSFQSFAISSYSQQRLNLDVKNNTIIEIFKKIESASPYRFVYRQDLLSKEDKVSIYAKDATIDYVMQKMLSSTNLTYKTVDANLIIITHKNANELSLIASWVLNGKVVNENNEPIPGASITVSRTKKGASTDLRGNFIIEIESTSDSLTITAVGYKTKTIVAGTERDILITLETDIEGQKLNEVVVVGFGTQKKKDMVSAVTTVNAEELKVPSSNLTTAFAGRIAGMIAFQRSGEPGADNADFFIRGATSFGYSSAPLILIDGIEMTKTDLARLQPDDIASFSVLKDAPATAVYGARGANGVIMVVTKKGKTGQAKIFLRAENSITTPTKNVELADPVTYMKMANEAVLTRNPLSEIFYSQDKIDKTGQPGSNPYIYPANNWRETLFKKYANTQRYNLNVSGGGGVARYYVSGSYMQDNGLLKVDKRNNFNSGIKNTIYTLLSNVDIDVTPSTLLRIKLDGNFNDYRGPINTGAQMYNMVVRSNPVLFPAYFPVDSAHSYVKHILFGNYDEAQYTNPYAEMVKGYRDYSRSLMLAQLEVQQKLDFITKGLEWRTMFNTNRVSAFSVNRFYNPYFYAVSGYDAFAGTFGLRSLNPESGTEYLNYNEGRKELSTYFYLQSVLDYNRVFNGKHNVSSSLIYLMDQRLNANSGSLQNSLPFRNTGLSGRFTYGYDSRYYTEFSFGYNGSERFYADKRFGFFPSFGVGWNISNERFFENLKTAISNFKLRGSYGFIGMDQIGDPTDRFFYLSEVNMNSGSRGFTFGRNDANTYLSGIYVNRYSNINITWEKSQKINLGLDLSLYNKFNLRVDAYKQYTTNILMTRASIPETMGLSAPQRASVGTARAQGFEASADYKQDFGSGLSISFMGNFTYAKGMYDKYEEPVYAEAYRSRVGQPIHQRWGLIAERLFIDDAEAQNSPTQNFGGQSRGGDIKYLDINKDGKITEADMVPIGYPVIPEITYGFGFSTLYKGFDLSAFFQGIGRESFWIDVSGTSPFVNQTQVIKAYADSYWSEDNQNEYALWPRLSNFINQNNTQRSTWFMRDGSFLRLKSVELGYTLPRSIIRRFHMSNCRIYFSGINLLTFSSFKMWDPEMGGQGLGYPIQKVFNVGINLSFN